MDKLRQLLQTRKNYVEKTPSDVYNEVAEDFEQYEPEDISAIGGVESQHGKFDRPLKGGSARGLFQFQPETAEYLQPGSSDSLDDMNTQAELMKKYLEKNDSETIEDAYIKHNLGPTGANKFLSAPDNADVSSVIPKRVIKANPGLYNVKTVGEAKELIKQKLNKGRQPQSVEPSILDKLFKGNK